LKYRSPKLPSTKDLNRSYHEQQKLMKQIQRRKIHKYSWDYFQDHKDLPFTELKMPPIDAKTTIDKTAVLFLIYFYSYIY